MSMWSPALGDPSPRGRALSLADWIALGEDETGELVDGYLEDEEVSDAIHELAVTWLAALFRGWLGGRGFVLGSAVKLVLRQSTGRKPDLCVYLPGRRPPPRRGALSDAPDLVIEVVTPTPRDERRDRVEKMEEYAQFGVRWYWIIDPALATLEVFALEADGRYKKVIGATGGVHPAPRCAGLTVDVGALWAERWRFWPSSPWSAPPTVQMRNRSWPTSTSSSAPPERPRHEKADTLPEHVALPELAPAVSDLFLQLDA